MDISRDEVMEALPVYVADEVNVDTQTLIEMYLETEVESINPARLTSQGESQRDPLSQEESRDTHPNTNLIMLLYFMILAVVLAVVISGFVMYFWVVA